MTRRWNTQRAERIFTQNANRLNRGENAGPAVISQNGVEWYRRGKKKVDCKHCGKWLRRDEIRKWKVYCNKCGPNMNTPIIREKSDPEGEHDGTTKRTD